MCTPINLIRPPGFPQLTLVEDFLVYLDGEIEFPIQPGPSGVDPSSAEVPSLPNRLSSRFSMASSLAVFAAIPTLRASSATHVASGTGAGAHSEDLNPQPYRTCSVRTFCESVVKSPRAADANIMSIERYGDLHGVSHRFLILHVTRACGKDFYIRLDRDPGKSNVVDTVAISGRLEHLLDATNNEAGIEAIMVLPTPAPLVTIARILHTVVAESLGYKSTRDNCWFFSSTIQEMVILMYGAKYESASLNHLKIGAEQRGRIRLLMYSSIANEIELASDKILRSARLIADSTLTKAVKSVLNTIKKHHKFAFHSFLALDAFQVSSSTRRLLIMLHDDLFEHLRRCYGAREARTFSKSFPDELIQTVLSWEQSLQSSSRNVDDIITLISRITDLLRSSKVAEITLFPGPKVVLFALEFLGLCTVLDSLPIAWRFQMNDTIPNLQSEFDTLITLELKLVCRQWTTLLCVSNHRDNEIVIALSRAVPSFLYWIAAMGIMGEIDQACRGLKELAQWLESDEQSTDTCRVVYDLYGLVMQSKSALALSSLSILGSSHPFIPLGSSLNATFPTKGNAKCRIVARDMDSSHSWPSQVMKIPISGILSATFSPDGRYLASGSSNGSVCVWDATTGALFRELKGRGTGWVGSVAFSPEGHLASASNDCVVRIWDPVTGGLLRELKGHASWVRSVAFSQDGCRLASASNDRTVCVWDVAAGTLLRQRKGHSGWVRSVAFSPNGDRLASASEDHTVCVWNENDWEGLYSWEALSGWEALYGWEASHGWDGGDGDGVLLRELKGHTAQVWSVSFSPDGRHLVSDDRNMRVWDVETGALVRKLEEHAHSVSFVKFSPDGRHLVSASLDGTLRIGDTAFGAPTRELRGHTASALSAEFSPDGSLVVSSSDDGTMRVWQVTGVSDRERKGHTGSVLSAEYSPDGRHLVSATQDDVVCIWDAADGRCIGQRQLGWGFDPRHISFSADGLTIRVQGPTETEDLSFPDLENISPPASPLFFQSNPSPVCLDHNALCIKQGDTSLYVCWLPDYFEPSTPIAAHGNNVCIGGKEGMIAFLNLDGLLPPSVQ